VKVVETAARKGVGLTELEEALLLQADLLELRASRSRDARALVVEAKVHKGHGPVATVREMFAEQCVLLVYGWPPLPRIDEAVV
jgi:hypothetical protein